MTKPTIEIRISADGTVSAVTHGAKGAECLQYIPRLEELLGAATVDSEYTSEFYETGSQAATVEQAQSQAAEARER